MSQLPSRTATRGQLQSVTREPASRSGAHSAGDQRLVRRSGRCRLHRRLQSSSARVPSRSSPSRRSSSRLSSWPRLSSCSPVRPGLCGFSAATWALCVEPACPGSSLSPTGGT